MDARTLTPLFCASLFEVEYLAWAIETRNRDGERWLRSAKKERETFFRPAKLRQAVLCEPTERRRGIDHWKRRIGVLVWIACHKGIAVTGFLGCRADGILETRPGQRERASDDVAVDRCDGEDANETLHAVAGASSSSCSC